ncbi:MAG: DUF4326 domain-containing protein [Candidatus Acidiferrales bacterium]
MLDIPGLELELAQPALQGQDWAYLPPSDIFDEDWTEADLAALWEFAQQMPRKREQQLYGRMRLPRWTCKNPSHPKKWSADIPKPQKSKAKYPSKGFVSSEANPKCPICGSENVEPVNKLLIGLGSFSISATKRGLSADKVNPKDGYGDNFSKYQTLADAPLIVQKLAAKLTKMNGGKDVNYLSFIAYENERDHIGWHQHNEDRCRDAKVYILSMGEERTFGVRQVCKDHRLPAKNCVKNCETTCLDGPTALCRRCSAQMQARNTCPECESVRPGFKGKRKGKPWTAFQPEHGSIIVLEAAANETVEHAILQDKGPKGLRISINTKNIRPEDVKAVEGAGVTRLVPDQSGSASDALLGAVAQDLIPSGTFRKVSPQVNGPHVYSIKRKHPKDAVYVGCAGSWKCCKCHEKDVRSGSVYGNSYTPRVWGGHKQNPIAQTPEEYRQKLDAKWKSNAPKDVAWKERATKDLRGKNLLCWCLQPEDVDGVKVTKAEGCHARVLFEYVNRKDQ